MFSITATEKPKWHDLRWKLSNALVWLARRVYPRNPEVNAFLMQVMTDQMIYGQSVVRVNPAEMYKTPNVEVQGPGAASSRTVPCNDGLAGAPTEKAK